MVRISWRDEDDGRHIKVDDGSEIILGDGNVSYKENKTMRRRNDEGLNIAVKIAVFFCLFFFSIVLFSTLIQYIFSGGF